MRKVLAACHTGACFGEGGHGAKASDSRLARCLQPLEHEAEALAPSHSPYAYAASAWLLERAEQCVAEPGSSDDSTASRAIVAAEVQVELTNQQQASKLLDAAASASAPAWQRARLLLARASLARSKAAYADEETLSREALKLLENGQHSALRGDAEAAHAHALASLGRFPEALTAALRAVEPFLRIGWELSR